MGLELQDFFSCYDDAYVVIPSCLGCGIASSFVQVSASFWCRLVID